MTTSTPTCTAIDPRTLQGPKDPRFLGGCSSLEERQGLMMNVAHFMSANPITRHPLTGRPELDSYVSRLWETIRGNRVTDTATVDNVLSRSQVGSIYMTLTVMVELILGAAQRREDLQAELARLDALVAAVFPSGTRQR